MAAEGEKGQGRALVASLEEALELLIGAAKTARQNIAVYPVKAELTHALLTAELALTNHRAAQAKGAKNA